jgi:hypothetical protein
MRIDPKLNLVFPVELNNGSIAHIYSVPIGRAVFENFYDVLGSVFGKCFDEKDSKQLALTAPQIAFAALKSVSKATGEERQKEIEAGLINEMVRLTTVMHLESEGWHRSPLFGAVKAGILDDDTEAEVLSNITFFTAVSRTAPRAMAGTFLDFAASLREWLFLSSTVTEYMSSLPISTPAADTTRNNVQVPS